MPSVMAVQRPVCPLATSVGNGSRWYFELLLKDWARKGAEELRRLSSGRCSEGMPLRFKKRRCLRLRSRLVAS